MKGDGMTKRWAVLVLASALIASGLLAGALVPAASQGATTTSFTYCEKNRVGFNHFINEGKEKFGPGDWAVFTSPQFNPRTGKKVARHVGRFTFVKSRGQRDGYFIIDITVLLPKGKITVYGSSRFSQEEGRGAKYAVTGGTGSYNNARGAVISQRGKCDGARGMRITYNLILQ
jgi:hypothetical protein